MLNQDKVFTDRGIAELKSRLGISEQENITLEDDGFNEELAYNTPKTVETTASREISFPWPVQIGIDSSTIRSAADGTITLDLTLSANDVSGVTNYEYRIVSV